jgi:hypothetical protein
MQRLPAKLALTGTLAVLLAAIPVSLDLSWPAADRTEATASRADMIGIGLKLDSAEARVGRPATPASVAGVARRTTRRTVVRTTPYVAPAAVVAPAAAAAAVATGAAVAASRCTTVWVNGVKVRRCVP